VSLRICGGSYLAFAGSLSIGSLVSFNALFITVSTAVTGLTMRFYDPCYGRVLFDGTDLRDVRLDPLYEQPGVVFQ